MTGLQPRTAGILLSTALVVCLSTARADGSATSEPAGLLLYSAELSGKAQLFTVRPDGTGRRQLTRGPTEALNAEWSPGGRSIVFERFVQAEERAAVMLMSADGSGIRELTPAGYQGDPSFTPEGSSIVFTRDPIPGDNGIWLLRTDGSGLRRLTRNPFSCCDEGAAVSPDGKTVTFARGRRLNGQRALFAVGIDGGGLKRLTPWQLGPPRHAWSPDGQRIVITLEREDGANVATIRRDGSDVRPVTRFTGDARNAYAGSYSPDGKWLAVRIEERGSFGLYVVRPDGTGLRRVMKASSRPSGIDWGVRR